MEAYDVGVPEGRGDLDLSLDVNSVQVIGDSLLPYGLDGHLPNTGRQYRIKTLNIHIRLDWETTSPLPRIPCFKTIANLSAHASLCGLIDR